MFIFVKIWFIDLVLNGEKIKIHQARIINEQTHNYPAGKIIDDKLNIACKTGVLQPQILQRAGKNKMILEEFLRGFIGV